jgi:hypothetical protein
VICAPSARVSACACAAVTPGFSRPIIAIVLPQRFVSGLSGNGKVQIEVAARREDGAKSNDAGSTPTTVSARRSASATIPTIAGSDAKRRAQSAWLEHHRLRPVPLAFRRR